MTPLSTRHYWTALAILFLADGVKHILNAATGPAPLSFDAGQYWELAGRAAAGDWRQLHSSIDYRTPLYPAFLGVFRLAFGDFALAAVVIVQHVLHLATGLLTALLCLRITESRTAAILGYGFSVLCVSRLWFANVLLAETLFTFLLTATVCALAAYHRNPSAGRSIAFAGLLGVTILVRPTPQYLWIPLIGLFFFHGTRWAAQPRPRRRILQHALIAAAVLCLVLTPWFVRNWVLFGEPFLARLPAVNKWQVCFQGGAAARLPIPEDEAGRQLRQLLGGPPQGDIEDRYCYAVIAGLQAKGLSNEQIDGLITEVCTAAVREHPVPFLRATVKRFVNFWRCVVGPYPFYADDAVRGPAQYEGQHVWRIEPAAHWYETILRNVPARNLRWNEMVALLAASGTLLLIANRRTRPLGLSLGTIFLYFAAVTAVVEIENYRYRMVLEPCLISAIACGFCRGR